MVWPKQIHSNSPEKRARMVATQTKNQQRTNYRSSGQLDKKVPNNKKVKPKFQGTWSAPKQIFRHVKHGWQAPNNATRRNTEARNISKPIARNMARITAATKNQTNQLKLTRQAISCKQKAIRNKMLTRQTTWGNKSTKNPEVRQN